MKPSLGRASLLGPGLALYALVIVVPSFALVARSVRLGRSETGSPWLTSNQWSLLGESVQLAASSAGLAVLLSLPAAYVVGRIGRVSRTPVVGALLLAPLLLPPMIYAFGWQWVGLPVFAGGSLCRWIWASWCWSVPALLIGSGWARAGRDAYAAAVLDAGPAVAFFRAVLPMLARHALIAALILFVLFLNEYSVPHACMLTVLATELLALAANSTRSADVLVPSMPVLAVTAVASGLVYWLWRGRGWAQTDSDDLSGRASGSVTLVVLAIAVGLATTITPLVLLVREAGSWAAMAEAWRTYHTELGQSIGVALGAGLVAVVMGVMLGVAGRWRGAILVLTLLFGALPAALVGEAVLVAYQPVGLIYNHWPLLVIGYAARFGWIGLLTAWLAGATVGTDTVAQARTDGAGESSILLRLAYVPNLPLLLCGVAVVAAFSLADVAVSSLLQVPSIAPISLKLIEKFHRFEDGMLVALSLWLVAGAIPAVVLSWAALRVRGRMSEAVAAGRRQVYIASDETS